MSTQLTTYGSGMAAQATELVFYGYIEAATDTSLADLLRNPSAARTVLEELFASDVPAIVVQALAETPTVEGAAAAAVNGKLAAADVPVGSDKRVLPGGPTGTTGWYEMDEASGYVYAFVVFEERDWYILGGFTLEGYWKAHTEGAGGAGGVSLTSLRDAIVEWWGTLPERIQDLVLAGALGDAGQVLAVDYNPRTGWDAVQVATAPRDDHNTPGRATVPTRGGIMPFTHHNIDNLLRIVLGPGTGRAASYTGRPVATFTMGGNVSYAQPWHLPHLATAETNSFGILTRVNLKWVMRDFLAPWKTGIAEAASGVKNLVEFPEQSYMHSVSAVRNANGDTTKIGIVAGYNPTAVRDAVYLVELDLTTGKMHDKAKPSVVHDINAGEPLQSSALTPVIPEKETGTRRLFGLHTGNGGNLWKILTMEYTGTVEATSTTGVITEYTFDVDKLQLVGTRTLGTAGKHLQRYPAGAQFADDGTVWYVTESNNVYTLWHEGRIVRQSKRPMFRPMPVPTGGETKLLISDVGSYINFDNWDDTNLLAIMEGA